MAFLRRGIDANNKEIQFEIDESANSVNLKFDDLFTQEHINAMTVRVERVAKNTANQVLYSGVYSDVKRVLTFAFGTVGNILPFAIGKSLELNDEVKLLITLQFPEAGAITKGLDAIDPSSFQYEINTTLETTKNPLVIKKVVVDEELSLSTEFYPLILLSKVIESYETVVIVQNEEGKDVPKKVYLGNAYINSLKQDNSDFHAMITSPNQNVTIKGTSTNYLILLQP